MTTSTSSLARPYSRLTVGTVALLAGVIIGVWLLGTPSGLLGKADAVGYAICHRIDVRSFHTHDRPLPLCARCTGIYLGVITGLAFLVQRGRGRSSGLPPTNLLLVMALSGAALAFDGLNSYLSLFAFYRPLYQPHNTLRLITGMGFGLAMISVVLPVFNSIAWADPDPAPALRSFKEMGVIYGIARGHVRRRPDRPADPARRVRHDQRGGGRVDVWRDRDGGLFDRDTPRKYHHPLA